MDSQKMSASFSPSLASSLAEEADDIGFDIPGFTASAFQNWQSLAATLDHTLLDPVATSKDIVEFCEQALPYRFACVVVHPCWISLAHSILAGSGIPVGSVIGFPLGTALTRSKCEEADAALRLGARELDMVLNLGALKGRDNALVHADITAVREHVHAAGAKLKVILETCRLTLEEKLRAAEICLAAGVDFLKTSTGFSTGGATVEDVSLLRGVAGGRCGVKASGGIRTLESVHRMVEAGADRIGTSSAVSILQSYIAQEQLAPAASLVQA